MANPYDILGVPRGSSKEACKKAYRKLCVKHHPDNGGDKNIFDTINKAWGSIESGNTIEIGVVKVKSHLAHRSLFKFYVV